MVVYLDLVFIYNTMVNFIFLFCLKKLLKQKIVFYRLSLAAIAGGAMVFAYLFGGVAFTVLKITGGVVIIILASSKCQLNKLIIEISAFYLVNLAFVGVLTSFGIINCFGLFCGIVAILALVFFEQFKMTLQVGEQKLDIVIVLNRKTHKLSAFLDTGNLSTDNGIPIIYLNPKYYDPTLRVSGVVNVETINGTTTLITYIPDDFYIIIKKKKVKKDVVVAFVKTKEECLLNNYLLC